MLNTSTTPLLYSDAKGFRRFSLDYFETMFPPKQEDDSEVSASEGDDPQSVAKIQEVLKYIKPAEGFQEWVRVGLAIKFECSDSEGFDLFDDWSSRANNYGGIEVCSDQWDTFVPNGGIKLGSLVAMAKVNGFAFPDWWQTWPPRENEFTESYERLLEQIPEATKANAKTECKLYPMPIGSLFGNPQRRRETIKGLLRDGEVLNAIASSKVGKTILVANLAWCVATGRQFLGFETLKSRVLVIDNELHSEELAYRHFKVAEAMNIPIDQRDNIEFLCLRGQLLNVHGLNRIEIERGKFGLVILDAEYKFLAPGMSEMDAGAMTEFYSIIDHYADVWQSAIALTHHNTKGDQSGKAVTDMGSGSGVISRACDTHLVIREHNEQGLFVAEAVTRSNKRPEPRTVRLDFPLWQLDTDTAPEVKQPTKPRTKRDDDQEAITKIVDLMHTVFKESGHPVVMQNDLTNGMLYFAGSGKAKRLLAVAEDQGQIKKLEYKGKVFWHLPDLEHPFAKVKDWIEERNRKPD